MLRPVILTTFANDRYGPTTGYLRDLVSERRAIEGAWSAGPVELVARGNITLDELFDLFARYGDRVVVWHHGGHADGDALFLETEDGRPAPARVDGLAARIGQLAGLRLMVLNACSTADQVAVLHARCAAPIVATDRAVTDAAARDFAARLHRDLAADLRLADAFTSAVSRVESAAEGPSRILRPGALPEGGADASPWRLHIHPAQRASARWRLSNARRRQRLRRVGWAVGGLLLVAGIVWAGWPTGPGPTPEPCVAERCNGADDDCDEAIDEAGGCTAFGMAPVWGAAQCLAGACQMTACPDGWHDIDGRYETGCEYACHPAGGERCDAIDDDCDGIVDEGFEGCDLRCDGVDDDGDGRSDEGCPITRCGPERAGHAPVPPCNGCPDGIAVPAGWVCIPPGDAMIEAPPTQSQRRPAPGPIRRVVFERPLLMMATEVTRAEWAAIARSAGVGEAPSLDHCAASPADRCPVDRLNWYDGLWFANALSAAHGRSPCYPIDVMATCTGTPGSGCEGDAIACAWRYGPGSPILHCPISTRAALQAAARSCAGYRLPTGDEWAYAARAGITGRAPPGGTAALHAAAWVRGNAYRQTHPVASRAPNPWGLWDMLGNVAEPVHDGRFGYRGGDWSSTADDADFVAAHYDSPASRLHRYGLRLVRPVP